MDVCGTSGSVAGRVTQGEVGSLAGFLRVKRGGSTQFFPEFLPFGRKSGINVARQPQTGFFRVTASAARHSGWPSRHVVLGESPLESRIRKCSSVHLTCRACHQAFVSERRDAVESRLNPFAPLGGGAGLTVFVSLDSGSLPMRTISFRDWSLSCFISRTPRAGEPAVADQKPLRPPSKRWRTAPCWPARSKTSIRGRVAGWFLIQPLFSLRINI